MRPPSSLPENASPGRAPEVLPSRVVGLCGVAAFASLLFSLLLYLNR